MPAPSRTEMTILLDRLIARMVRMLTRGGYLEAEPEQLSLNLDSDDPLMTVTTASVRYRSGPQISDSELRCSRAA